MYASSYYSLRSSFNFLSLSIQPSELFVIHTVTLLDAYYVSTTQPISIRSLTDLLW